VIFLDDYLTVDEVEVVEWSPNVEINLRAASTPAAVDALYRKLVNKHPALAVYKKADVPAWMQFGTHRRVPEIIGVAEKGWIVTSRARVADRPIRPGGAHGYDPRNRDLHGLFIAAGPGVRRGYLAPEFQNIHIYDFMCRLMGFVPAKNDGDPRQTANFFAR
jgi:ectonucleotide pyrophosphatase/phosphodiesterase family protein 5